MVITDELQSIISDFELGLTPILLVDQNGNHGIYTILNRRMTDIMLAKDYFYRVVYPLKELAEITEIKYQTLHRRFYRKNGIFTDPSTGKVYCLLISYFDTIDIRHRIMDYITDIKLSEAERMKNLFGYLTLTGFKKVFPYVDFSIPEIKFLYQFFLIPVETENYRYYALVEPPKNLFGINLTATDIGVLYKKAVVNYRGLAVIKNISLEYAHKIIADKKERLYLPGMGKHIYCPVIDLIGYDDFAGYMISRYEYYKSDANFEGIFIFPSIIQGIKQKIITPLRKNLSLKINIIEENHNTKKEELEYDNICAN